LNALSCLVKFKKSFQQWEKSYVEVKARLKEIDNKEGDSDNEETKQGEVGDEDYVDQDDDTNEDDVDEDYLEKQEDEQYHNNEEDAEESNDQNITLNNGGFNVGRYDASCTHVMVHELIYAAAKKDKKTSVIDLWVVDALDMGMLVDSTKILYKPVRDLNGIPGSKSLCNCLTGYQSQD